MPASEDKKLGNFPKSKEGEMSIATLSLELRTYGRRRWPLTTDEFRKSRLADLLKMSARRMKSYWDAEQTAVPRGAEIERIRALIGNPKAPTHDHIEADRALEARLAQLEEELAELRSLLVADAMADRGRQASGDRRKAQGSGRRSSDRG
ncbi:hypothetical protein [Pelagibacterium sp. H642]|uniref:hypothetical protein n=1 Tax=Pelagibacterium sp. H642 TaxID=1881069 RepID=UPI0028167ACA|nr:hypothetical protein [Pelagibacterium sp. H642]WMT90116.1 hypothetical protein NO934_15155 [Pelagibacterium sp. H642]